MELLLAFILGVASSSVVGYVIYRRQKTEAAKSERRLVVLMEQQLLQSGRMFSTVSMVTEQQEVLQRDFEEIKEQLTHLVTRGEEPNLLSTAGSYSAVAGALASGSVGGVQDAAPSSDHLSVEVLRRLHRDLFPRGYEIAGELREIQVWVGPPGSSPDRARFVPPPPEEVPNQLDALLRKWNAAFPKLKESSRTEQISAIAQFHHRFVSLHPFLDGNGALARVLLGMQVRDLMQRRPVDLPPSDPDYYSALQAADGGDLVPLTKYFHQLLIQE